MKKLILDVCTKTVFSFNSKFYKQIEYPWFAFKSCLGQILITELESTIAKELCVFTHRYIQQWPTQTFRYLLNSMSAQKMVFLTIFSLIFYVKTK